MFGHCDRYGEGLFVDTNGMAAPGQPTACPNNEQVNSTTACNGLGLQCSHQLMRFPTCTGAWLICAQAGAYRRGNSLLVSASAASSCCLWLP